MPKKKVNIFITDPVVKIAQFQEQIDIIAPGFIALNLYEVVCPEGHHMEVYVKQFIKSARCPICNAINEFFLFNYIKKINLRHKIVQNKEIKAYAFDRKYSGIIPLEILVFNDENQLFGKIYFITKNAHDSERVVKDCYTKWFDYRELNNEEYCKEFISKFNKKE